jgi:hypothetical protein
MSFLQRAYWPCPFCDKGVIEVLIRPSIWSAKRSKGGKAGVKTTWSRSKEEVVVLTSECQACGKSKEEIEKKWREDGII